MNEDDLERRIGLWLNNKKSSRWYIVSEYRKPELRRKMAMVQSENQDGKFERNAMDRLHTQLNEKNEMQNAP